MRRIRATLRMCSWNQQRKNLEEVLTRLRLSQNHARRGRLNAYDTGNIVPFIRVTELLCITFSVCDRLIFWLLSGFFFVIVLLGPEGIIQQVVRNDLSGQQMGVPVPPVDVPYESCGVLNLWGL